MIKLDLEIDEINCVLMALGELPSRTGALNVILKIKEQADPQVPAEEVEVAEEAVEVVPE
jgi:hypothetical protein